MPKASPTDIQSGIGLNEPRARHSADPGLSAHEKNVLTRLEKTGWFINSVFASETVPNFAYSFGLYGRFKHPEIIVFGLPSSTMGTLINDIGQHAKEGRVYSHGETTSDLLEDYVCRFQRVDPRWYSTTLTWTGWFYRSFDFPALQLIWPDRAGVLPWDPNCTEAVRDIQLDLSKPPRHQ